LFGCGNAEGHTWAKFFAHFGWRRGPSQPKALSRNRPTPNRSLREDGPTWNEQRTVRDQIIFWGAMVATVAGIVSAATDLAGIVTK
jgi:hypothetical protein